MYRKSDFKRRISLHGAVDNGRWINPLEVSTFTSVKNARLMNWHYVASDAQKCVASKPLFEPLDL